MYERSFYEVREDVVETGLVDAPDQSALVLEEACAFVDVLLVDAQDDPSLELVDNLQVEGLDELPHNLRPFSSASKHIGIV